MSRLLVILVLGLHPLSDQCHGFAEEALRELCRKLPNTTLMPLRMVPPWFLQNPQHFPVAIAALAALTTNMCASIATKEQKMKLFPAKVASWGRWQSLSFVMNVNQSLAMLLRNLIQVVTFIFIFRSV